MKKIFLTLIILSLASCFSVNPEKLDKQYAESFARSVNCAYGPNQVCFCFVASRQTGNSSSTGIGMAIDSTGKSCQ